jgi:Fe-S-cluster-containing hydrogenase component 2
MAVSAGLAVSGFPSDEELVSCPGVPSAVRLAKGRCAVIECVQKIPCNPCVAACPFGAICITGCITELPVLDGDKCTGCGRCVSRCPGLAIFLVDLTYSESEAAVDFPWEFLPLPEAGQCVDAVNRAGETVCRGRVLEVRSGEGADGAAVVRLAVSKEFAREVRGMRRL